MFQKLLEWCEQPQNRFQYERGKNWCDCVDFTDYMNIYTPKYYLTIYCHDNGSYSCSLFQGKETIAVFTNFETADELIKLVEEYPL